jgi:hypothetical protein
MSAPQGPEITRTPAGAPGAGSPARAYRAATLVCGSAAAASVRGGGAGGCDPVASVPVYREDARGRAVPAERPSSFASTGRIERSLRRAVDARPADGLSHVGLLVGPDVPDRFAPCLTLAANALVVLAARYAGARRLDIVVGLRGDELVAQARYDGRGPGDDPAVDAHAARLARVTRTLEACGGTVRVDRVDGRTVTRLSIAVPDAAYD